MTSKKGSDAADSWSPWESHPTGEPTFLPLEDTEELCVVVDKKGTQFKDAVAAAIKKEEEKRAKSRNRGK